MDTLFFLIKVKVNDQKHHQKQKEKKNKLINIPVWLNSQVPRVNESTNKHLTHLSYCWSRTLELALHTANSKEHPLLKGAD